MKRLRTYLFLLLLLFLTACGNKGKLDEGDCKGIVSFSNVPKEFTLLEENLQADYKITVTLKNLTTEKEYEVILNQANGFKQNVSLHPGNYKLSAHASMANLVGLEVKTLDETVTFDRSRDTVVSVIAKNADEFAQRWMATHPEAEILSADKFSGLIQVNRKVMTIKEAITELGLSDLTETLRAYDKATLTDKERGITIIMQNQTSSDRPLSECDVLSITVTKNTVVFPDGVTLGSSPEKVCHRVTGLYGEPTKFEGMFLYGWSLDETRAVYQDKESGNRITIAFSSNGKSIESIKYELKVFED